METTRRLLLTAFLAAPLIPVSRVAAAGQAEPALPLTRDCGDDHAHTAEREAGPFFKPASPLKRDLFPDSPRGERITVAGFVVDDRCRPLAGSLVEIWHADQNGDYDEDGFRLRGHQLTDEHGRWWFNTIVPAHYPGRTRHFHFKVQRPAGRVLTTQLFFPDEPRNARDRLFDETLLMKTSPAGDGRFARFDFIV
jgi:protocatechuate 3,4-dioxygenase beta subunit